MPSNKSVSQVSINLDLVDDVETAKEEEESKIPQIHITVKNVCKYQYLTVYTKNGVYANTMRQGVCTKKTNLPTFRCFAQVFAPALILSCLAPLPFYVYSRDFSHMQDYPVTICNVTSSVVDGIDYLIEATYEDENKIRHNASFDYYIGGSEPNLDVALQHFETRIGSTFPCHYHNQSIIPTEFPSFIENYALHHGEIISVALVAGLFALIIISLLVILCFIQCEPVTKKTKIYKETFENFPDLEIVNWGDVDGEFKQFLHASVCALCVPEQENPRCTRYVKFLNYVRRPYSKTVGFGCGMLIVGLFLVGLIIMFIEAFYQTTITMITVLWCLLTMLSLVPSCVFMHCYVTCIYEKFVVQVEVTKTGDNNENRTIYMLTVKYYPNGTMENVTVDIQM